MKVSIKASTKIGYVLPVTEAVHFGGLAAGVCYMPDTWSTLEGEPTEKTGKRANQTINNAHHSVFDHSHYTFVFEEIPKILAMVFNNEKIYDTSEKSGRYTKMTPSPREEGAYGKWLEILKTKIATTYPDFDEKKVQKMAQENARYFISVFTPATTMVHTLDFKQLNYLLYWCEKFISSAPDTDFNRQLKNVFSEFVPLFSELRVTNINDEAKEKFLSLFDDRQSRQEEFGENYCTSYDGSFTQLAQAQRHRTLSYTMIVPNWQDASFYIPPIISDDSNLVSVWISDMKSLADLYPQGMMVNIRERGTYENFMRKCTERLCSNAQLEISLRTRITFDKYLASTEYLKPEVYSILKRYDKNARCAWGYPCKNPCSWGNKQLERKV